MAPNLADAEAMLAAARASGKVAVLGYNYIQNPAIRHIRKLLDEGAIGAVNHVRIEMDEDFMADPEAPFQKRHEASGYGALDDFGVHPLSLIHDAVRPRQPRDVRHGQALSDAQDAGGRARRRDLRHRHHPAPPGNGASGFIAVNRTAWGRKGRIAIQIFGAKGTILYDQERMNEFQLYSPPTGRPSRVSAPS